MNNLNKYAHIERERRFLLLAPPPDLDLEGTYSRIIDRYIPDTRMRLRRMETPNGRVLAYKMTQKFVQENQPAHQCMITNIYLEVHEYEKMACLGGIELIKRRYHYHDDDIRYSIDVFSGPLRGLVLAEVESLSDAELLGLRPPSFALCEVTNNQFFTGGNLVQLSSAEFRAWLVPFHQRVNQRQVAV
jgi:CYTH domain-containing protein